PVEVLVAEERHAVVSAEHLVDRVAVQEAAVKNRNPRFLERRNLAVYVRHPPHRRLSHPVTRTPSANHSTAGRAAEFIPADFVPDPPSYRTLASLPRPYRTGRNTPNLAKSSPFWPKP